MSSGLYLDDALCRPQEDKSRCAADTLPIIRNNAPPLPLTACRSSGRNSAVDGGRVEASQMRTSGPHRVHFFKRCVGRNSRLGAVSVFVARRTRTFHFARSEERRVGPEG